MTTTRIKDLSTATPTGAEFLPFDSASGGTRKNSISTIMSTIGALLGFGSTTKDDFHSPGAWWVSTSNGGTAKHFASWTAAGFPSNGVVQLKCTSTASSTAEMARIKDGCVLDTSKNIVQTWRVCPSDKPAAAGTGDIYFGLAATDSIDGVLVNLSRTSSTDTWQLGTTAAGVANLESLTVAAGTYYEIRLTVSTTGTTVELSVDGGAFSTILAGVNAPSARVYVPYAKAKNTSGSGACGIAFDFVDTSFDRTATSAGTFIDDNAAFAGPVSISTSTPQAVGTAGSAGTGTKAAADDHVHALGEATLRTVAAGLTAALDVNSKKITSLADPTSAQDAATKAYVDSPGTSPTVATSSSASIAAADGNHGSLTRLTNSGLTTVTIDAARTPGLRQEFMVDHATGSVTFVGTGGLTVRQADGLYTATRRYAVVSVTVLDSSNAVLVGDLDS